MRLAIGLVLFWCVAGVTLAADPPGGFPPPEAANSSSNASPTLPSPPVEADLPVLPINLPAALRLANSQPIDVQVAAVRIKAALAALDLAWVQWLPTISLGGDYARHDGAIQSSDGNVSVNSHGSLMFGAGTGIGSTSETLSFSSAIFGPLVARQVVRAREADEQTALNDSMLAVTEAYFNVQQARGQLAGTIETVHKADELLRRVRKLASGLVSPLEISRVETELARLRESDLLARERWQVASAELVRLLRLQPTAQVEPVEPPHLVVNLIDPRQSIDDLIVMGLTNRPELASRQAQVQAALTLLRQEKLRPLIPSLLLRGYSTPASGTLAVGAMAAGPDGSLGSYRPRGDIDAQLLWQLDNLGFGNRAKIHIRDAAHQEAVLELFRVQDSVAADVIRAYSESRQSARRAEVAVLEVKLAVETYEKNLVGLGQTRRAGEIVQTVIRPQEALAAAQALAQAWSSYYTAVADSNRAQFRLYRALGNPAQCLCMTPDGHGPDARLAAPTPVPASPPPAAR